MKKICILMLIILFPVATIANNIIVRQTDYNCIPASLEMCYRILGDYNNSQYKIRRDMKVPEGEIYVGDMERYLNEKFVFTTKRICCEDSLINAIGEYPVLLVLDMKLLNFYKNYRGHSLVAVEYKDGYIKILDPDGGVESWYYAKSIYKALRDWNCFVYIIKEVKQT